MCLNDYHIIQTKCDANEGIKVHSQFHSYTDYGYQVNAFKTPYLNQFKSCETSEIKSSSNFNSYDHQAD